MLRIALKISELLVLPGSLPGSVDHKFFVRPDEFALRDATSFTDRHDMIGISVFIFEKLTLPG